MSHLSALTHFSVGIRGVVRIVRAITSDTPVCKACSMQWQGMRHVQRFRRYCFDKGYTCGDMVAAYHCATLKFNNSPGWVPRSFQQLLD